MIWKILSPIQFVLLFIWSGVCCIPALILRFILFNEKVFGWIEKYIWAPIVLLICGSWIQKEGVENIPKDRNFLFACNHESLMDIPALFMASPTFLYFISKKELAKVPFVGWAIWGAGMIFIDRSNKDKAMSSMKEAGEKAKSQGKNVVSFPEGSRSKTGEINVFKRGTFIISKKAKVDIIPCAVKGTREILPAGKYSIRPGIAKVKFGKPILVKDHLDKTAEEYAIFVRQEVIRLKASIR